jgi:hypothetical protein
VVSNHKTNLVNFTVHFYIQHSNLIFRTQEIDEYLGYLQENFKLTGNEVRKIATGCPRLVTKNLWKLEMIKFSIWEEMGFTKEETKSLLLKDPRVFLIRRFDKTCTINRGVVLAFLLGGQRGLHSESQGTWAI